MTSYEIRKYVDGRWLLDSVFDDKAAAVDEAKMLMERSRSVPAIRVVAVMDDTDGFREWTVFKQSIIDEENEQAMQRAYQAKREIDAARARRRSERVRRKAERSQQARPKSRSLTVRLLLFLGASIALAVLIVLLREQLL